MRLLNGYYIGKEGATCTYCNSIDQDTCSQVCTFENLKSANMKPLTINAKGMIENAVWDTYAVSDIDIYGYTFEYGVTSEVYLDAAISAYLQEKGISTKYTGKECSVRVGYGGYVYCNDTVKKTTNWTRLVGLMSLSDSGYAQGVVKCFRL